MHGRDDQHCTILDQRLPCLGPLVIIYFLDKILVLVHFSMIELLYFFCKYNEYISNFSGLCLLVISWLLHYYNKLTVEIEYFINRH